MPRKAAASPTVLVAAEVIDEIGEIEAALLPHKKRMARLEALRSQVRRSLAEQHPEKGFLLHGVRYSMEIGKNGWVSLVDVGAVFRSLGPKKFLPLVSVTRKQIEQLEDLDLLNLAVSKVQTGPRTLTVTAILTR